MFLNTGFLKQDTLIENTFGIMATKFNAACLQKAFNC